jgi:hypothetical protein
MIYTLPTNVTVTVAGTPVRLASTRTTATWLHVFALDNNNKEVYVGGCDPTSSATKQTAGVLAASRRGIKLNPGDSMLFPQSSMASPYDLHETWLDALQAGDGVSITYLQR